jgi:putative transposase
MARLPRKDTLHSGYAFHKLWRAHDRQRLLQEPAEKRAYLEEVAKDYETKCDREAFQLHAFCIMGNHVHEEGFLKGEQHQLSDHMRRSHGCFGLKFNKRRGRLGKVAHDRPKTLVIQHDEAAMRCNFYIHTNPVRANLAKTPWDLLWRTFSSCRLYSHGERNEQNRHIELPDWYMALGRTPEERQSAYRRLLMEYLRRAGLVKDRHMTRGHFIGDATWRKIERSKVNEGRRKRRVDVPAPP